MPATGPRTPEGKAASRGNALTHGLSASTLVSEVVGEDRFNEALAALHAEFRPAGYVEVSLVLQAAQQSVLFGLAAPMVRALARESLRAARSNAGTTPDAVFSATILNDRLARGMRYHDGAMARFQKTLRLLEAHQALRVQSGVASADAQTPGDATPAPTPPNIPAAPTATRESRFETLRTQLSTHEGCTEFIRAAINNSSGSTPEPVNAPAAQAHSKPAASDCSAATLRASCFLRETGVQTQAALAVAVELLAWPETPFSTLRSRSGIERRETLTRLIRLIRDADRRGDDRVILALQHSAEPP